jgi:hypothetical protein
MHVWRAWYTNAIMATAMAQHVLPKSKQQHITPSHPSKNGCAIANLVHIARGV